MEIIHSNVPSFSEWNSKHQGSRGSATSLQVMGPLAGHTYSQLSPDRPLTQLDSSFAIPSRERFTWRVQMVALYSHKGSIYIWPIYTHIRLFMGHSLLSTNLFSMKTKPVIWVGCDLRIVYCTVLALASNSTYDKRDPVYPLPSTLYPFGVPFVCIIWFRIKPT